MLLSWQELVCRPQWKWGQKSRGGIGFPASLLCMYFKLGVFLKAVWGKTEHTHLDSVCKGYKLWVLEMGYSRISALLPSHALWWHHSLGTLPLWTPPSPGQRWHSYPAGHMSSGGERGGPILLHSYSWCDTLFHSLPSIKWLYITLRYVSLPDLISIRQHLFSAPAIHGDSRLYTVSKWH